VWAERFERLWLNLALRGPSTSSFAKCANDFAQDDGENLQRQRQRQRQRQKQRQRKGKGNEKAKATTKAKQGQERFARSANTPAYAVRLRRLGHPHCSEA
jgi:hypothetical protein